jgi:MarR family transcriptional regulator, organic hydroperoxide resistance regulator
MSLFDRESLGFLLSQVVRSYQHRMQSLLSEYGLYSGQPPVLFMLWEQDGRSQTEFCEKLELKPSTVTVMLQRMEKAGLLQKLSDKEDLRVSRVFLTEKGKSIRAEVENAISKLDDECFIGFTDEEKILLRRFFLSMRNNLSFKSQ